MNTNAPLIRWPLLALLAGCPGDDKDDLADEITAGGVSLCAQISGEPEADTGFTWDLEGEVLADGPGDALDEGAPCRELDRVLQVQGSDGQTYNLGYALRDAAAAPLEAALPLSPGDPVQIELLATIGYFYTGYALTLTQGDALVAAFADHREPHVTGLRVQRGAAVAREPDECGEKTGWQMIFTGDEALTLSPVAVGALDVGGRAMSVAALAAWGWGEETTCTDLSGGWEWALISGADAISGG